MKRWKIGVSAIEPDAIEGSLSRWMYDAMVWDKDSMRRWRCELRGAVPVKYEVKVDVNGAWVHPRELHLPKSIVATIAAFTKTVLAAEKKNVVLPIKVTPSSVDRDDEVRCSPIGE